MATNTDEPVDRTEYTVEADADLTAFVEASTHKDATAAFWEGVNHDEEFTIGIGDGLDATFTMDCESVQTDAEGDDQRAVEVDATVLADVSAIDTEEAVEIFTTAINHRFIFDIELMGGLDVTVGIDSESLDADN